jgi:hypothetical protein
MNKFLFPKLAWFLLLLIPCVFLGFYPSYFSILLSPTDKVYHIHAFFMMLWVALSIIQPFLIQQKKIVAHKLAGKISYGIMPLVFITGYLVIQHTYYTNLARYTAHVSEGTPTLNSEEVLEKAAASIDIGLIYFIWLFTFYILAIVYRKKIIFHATYMFAATLTVLGPSVDRLIYNVTHHFGIAYNFFAQNVVLIFIILVLLALCIYQKRNGYSIKAVSIAMGIYGAGIIILLLFTHTFIWTYFVELIL